MPFRIPKMPLPPDMIPFDLWVLRLFDAPVADSTWHQTDDRNVTDLPSTTWLDYFTRVFENCGKLLASYSDAQIAQGLRFFIDLGESDHPLSLRDANIPAPIRLRCINSIYLLFRDCFAVRCSPNLSHLDEPGAGKLNGICYMWWDVIPYSGEPDDPRFAEQDQAVLRIMEGTLRLPNDACRESALHGLGHWQANYPAKVAEVVDRFVADHPNARLELREYAERARRGYVL